MKKVLFLSICLVALLAISSVSKADLYEMDADTAATMRYIDMSDAGTLWFVGYNPGDVDLLGPPDELYNAYPNMTYQVGFTGNLTESVPLDGFASMRIGLESPITLGADYDGFLLPISNDDGDVWEYRAYLIINGGAPVYSDGDWTSIYPASYGHTANLFVDQSILATDNIMVGFDIRWNTALSQSFNDNAGIGDTFSTSVVPVPGAILLGLLGMSAAGLKLRKFA